MATTDPTTAEQPLLVVDDLRTTFTTKRGPLRAVDGVSFSLERGQTMGIVGESGSGKSILVRTIMNLLPRSAQVEGSVAFEGTDVRKLPRERARHFWGKDIAMVFQNPMTSLNPVKKIGTQIADPLRRHLGLSRRAARERARELLEHVRIPEAARRLDQYPHELSGGMRQRVIIAIALACEPKLLIADEPTTALDVTVQKQILDLLSSLQAEHHMAMILITHDLGVVSGRADKVAVMYAGRFAEVGLAEDVFDRTRHPYTAALLRSIPRLDQPSHTRLETIPGRPPDMVNRPAGCPFAPRCNFAQPSCEEERPVLLPEGARHRYACFFPVGTPEGERALAENARANRLAGASEFEIAAVS
jgi:peptide/nickel transport system ATP-binding protein